MKERLLIFILTVMCIGRVSAVEVQTFDSVAYEISQIHYTQKAKANVLVKKLYAIAEQNPNQTQLIPQSLYWETVVNYSQGVNDSAVISKVNLNLEIYKAASYPFENALLRYVLAMNQVIASDYAQGLTNALESLTKFQQLNDSLFSARASQLLGTICYRTRNFEMAGKFLEDALSPALPKAEYYRTLVNMYSAWAFSPGHLTEALDALVNLLPVLENFGDEGLLAVTYMNTGACYYVSGQIEKGFECYKKSLNIIRHIDNKYMLVTLYLNMSAYLSGIGDFTTTRQYLEEARTIAIQNENDEQLSAVYHSMANMYDKLNNVDSAYFYISKYNRLRDNLLNKSKTIDSYQAYVSTFLESAKKELTIAEQEITLKNRWMIITLISAIALVLIAVFVLVIIQQKKRRLMLIKENEKREMEEHLLHVEKIQKINEEKHQEILETKIRELTSYSLLLSGKNKAFQQLLQLSQQLQKAKKEDAKEIEKSIKQLITNNLNMDNERSSFMFHFNEVHPNFFDKLKHLCSDLTENNLRMCAYFRINMSTKQVALILNVSNETIRNARYRLKKKLGLEEDDDLDSFLRDL